MLRYINTLFALTLLCSKLDNIDGAAVKSRGLGPAKPCSPDICKLPDCRCSGVDIPGNLPREKVPQMVMLSYDDAVNGEVYGFYNTLFADGELKNPNGCNATATFFVSHEYTEYQMVQELYHNRHEIADHTISHRTPITWWKSANYSQLTDEIVGQREILRKWGQVKAEDVVGFRVPFLQIGGNTMYQVLYDNKFLYDSSMPTQKFMDPPMWPYTLDYQSTQECVIPPCPTDSRLACQSSAAIGNMRRLDVVARHVNGQTEEPLWVHLMDAGHNPVSKPRYGCQCSDKWRYVCNCYPCLRWAGREDEFDWTPAAIQAQPRAIPPQWKHKAGTRTLGQLNPLNPLNPLVCAGDKALPRPSPERQQELVTEEVGGIARMRLPNGPYGPVAISGLPRFAGIATFARLPQLHEIQTLQASSEAVLLLRLVNAGAVEPNAEIRLGERTHPLCEIQGEVSLPVLPEDGSLKVDMAGKRFQALALWTLPQNSWHRHVFVDQDNADNALEVDVKLKKHFRKFDIALVGVPFDSGCSYRPGARFGPEAIRSNSRLTRPFLIAQQQRPLQERQVVDTGDVFATPFNIQQAIQQIYDGCKERLQISRRLLVFGGDHTLSYPSIKAVAEKFGPVVLVHFDSHLDTFPALWGQDVWHGAPFRNCWEEGLLSKEGSTHIGIRATTYSAEDFHDSDAMGIATLTAEDVHESGVPACVDVVRRRWEKSGGAPVYLSIDIDVLDPSIAPGTGTPEYGGLLAHQLLQFIRGLKGLPIVAADVVEVAPAYDHAGITSMAAANIMLEQIALISSCMDLDGFDT